MITYNRFFFILLILTFVFACSSEQDYTNQDLIVDYSNPQIVYSGRIDSSQVKGVGLYWSGTSIKFNFEGESIAGLFADEKGDNYYNVIIDNGSPFILDLKKSKRYYQLASKLSKGKHTIEIFKRAEWDRGRTSFYGFKIGGDAKVLPKSELLKRSIEFYGNSITAGYAIEDFSGRDSPEGTYTNNYLTYAALTARHFDANYHCTCRSGIGITVSWIPEIMPEIFDRINPTDANNKWDFSLYRPDIVVINLLQNDSWLVNMPDSDEFKMRFGTTIPDEKFIINAYQEFLANIRKHNPQAHIICSLGCMDAVKEGSKWTGYIKTAVANLEDQKIYTHFMPYIEAKAHPSIKDQEVMAKKLIGFIEENIDW